MSAAINIAAFVLILVALPETMYKRSNAPSLEEMSEIETPKDSSRDAAIKSTTGSCYRKGKPKSGQFGFSTGQQPSWRGLLIGFLTPFWLFSFPIVLWASLIVTFASNYFLMLTVMQAEAFTEPPYNFDSASVGYTNLAVLIGALIGLFTAGPLSDWTSAWLTRSNQGIREPEMRLMTMIAYGILMILGNLRTAFGFQYRWDWRVRTLSVTNSCYG